MVQLLYSCVTTGKTIALTTWSFVSKVMSLFFNALSRFVLAFLSRSRSLYSMAAVTVHNDFGAPEKSLTISIVSPSICHEVVRLVAMILVF